MEYVNQMSTMLNTGEEEMGSEEELERLEAVADYKNNL